MDTPSQPASSPASGCWHYGLLALAGLWVVAASVTGHLTAWTADQFFLIQGQPFAWFVWPLLSWGQALALGIAVVPLAFAIRAPRFRAVYQTWAIAVAYLALLALSRAFPATSNQPAALAQTVLSLLACVVLMAQKRSRGWGNAGAWLALAIAAIVALPWLAWGALGSITDTLLNLLAALSFGWFSALLLNGFLFGPLAQHSSGVWRDILRGGLAATVTLVILGSGFGFNGSQLLLLAALSLLGVALAGVRHWHGDKTTGALALLIGLTAAAPLMLIDPEEMGLILGGNEILQWATNAAFATLALAFMVSLCVGVAAGFSRRPPPTPIAFGAMVFVFLISLAVYIGLGQPGFHGEQLFVILKDQKDVSAAYKIADRTERLQYVYDQLTQHANSTQANLRKTLDTVRAEYTPYYLVNAIEVNGGPLVRLYLSLQPEVDRVIDSPHLRPLPQPIPVSEGNEAAPGEPQWNITSLGADRVWQELGVTGAGIIIGQSDSGVDGAHPALASQYRGRGGGDDYNWLDPWNGTRAPTDIGGHGTHTLGSIVGQGGIGVAPGAEWFACVNLARNLGNPPVYLECMQFMLAPYPQNGDALKDGNPALAAHVLNNSWGCPPIEGCDPTSLRPAVEALRAAGIFVVASAGNEGSWAPGTAPLCGSVSDPPALYDAAFSVGAVDALGDLAYFSSRGPVTVDGSGRVKPDISAPGEGVLSSTPGGTYATFSGTSMAGPHVVGAVALLWSANPKLIGDIDLTEQILRETARPYTGTPDAPLCAGDPANSVGVGLLDVYAAVQAALAKK